MEWKFFTRRIFSAMRKQNILQTLLFVIFFSIGAATLAVAILSKDLQRHYYNRSVFESMQQRLLQLKSLNQDYDFLLNQLHEDPNLIERLGPATLGTEPKEADTVYPKAKAEQLASAKKALTEDIDKEAKKAEIPKWLERCNKPANKTGLFIAAGSLIIISFVCFNFGRGKRVKS